MAVKATWSFDWFISDNFAVGQRCSVVLIINVALASRLALGPMPSLHFSLPADDGRCARAGCSRPVVQSITAIVLLPDQTTRVLLHKCGMVVPPHIRRVKVKNVMSADGFQIVANLLPHRFVFAKESSGIAASAKSRVGAQIKRSR